VDVLPLEEEAVVAEVVVVPLLEEGVVVAEVEEVEAPFESDSDATAENRSCTNFLNACRTSCTEPVDELEPSEVELAFQFCGWPLAGEGIEIPT
jgi:hypothetical protein